MTVLQTLLRGTWWLGPPGSERQRVAKPGLPWWHHFGYPNSLTYWRARDRAGLGACWCSSGERVFGEEGKRGGGRKAGRINQ